MNLKYIKLNKPHLRQHSNTYLLLGSVFFFVFACCLAWIAFWFLQTGWQTHLMDQKFEREGMKVEGYVSGFRYIESTGRGKYASKAGVYPIVSFDTNAGSIQLTAKYGRPLDQAQQVSLMLQKVDVIYQQDDPASGRVVKWHSSSKWINALIGAFLLAGSLLCFYFIPRFLALKTE